MRPSRLFHARSVAPSSKAGWRFWVAPLCAVISSLLATVDARAQVSLTTAGVPYTQTFDALATSGTANSWTDNTTLVGWYSQFLLVPTNPTVYRAENGGGNAGAIYSFGVLATNPLTERAFGSTSSGTPGTIFNSVRFVNTSGSAFTSLDISFFGEQWRNGGNTSAQQLDFQYQIVSAGTITDANTPSTGWADFNSLDFVSPTVGATAAALDGNASANRTARSATLTVTVNAGEEVWFRWVDLNDAGNDHGLAIDDLSVTPSDALPPDTAPSVVSTTPVDNATGVSVGVNVSVTFSEPVSASAGAFSISCATSGAHTFALTGGPTTFTLNPNTDFGQNEVCTVTVDDAQVTDSDGNDPPDTMAADYVFDFTTVDLSSCGTGFTAAYAIQGSGTASPLVATTVSTEGIVVGDFQGASGLKGFYIQDDAGDGDALTSDGLFVFDGSTPTVDVAVGDRVRVTGTVSESFTNTQINPPTSILVCSSGNTVPVATPVDLPESVNGDLEQFENMLVVFPDPLTVSGNFTLGRFGELWLSSDGRMFQQNTFDRTGTAASIAAEALNLRRYVVLDDGLSTQNPDPTPYTDVNNTRRLGDTVIGLQGVLGFDFSEYRVQPTTPPVFVSANARLANPAAVGGNVKITSFNVLNYFNGNGAGGGFPTSRGASTLAEFNRQRNKIIAAILATGADVLGIIEMENDGNAATSAIQDLVDGLNTATAPGTYAFAEGTTPGTDAIKNSIIYKPASVTAVGAAVNDTDAIWTGQARNPLAQTFSAVATGESFVFIVNHFTSKGCSVSDTGLDADQGDGQGCDNLQRTLQADALLEFVEERQVTTGETRVLVMGDLNADGEEDPIFRLEDDPSDTLVDGAGGLTDLVQSYVAMADRHAYQFGNRSGRLDHAFASKELVAFVSGATIWNINADEPIVLDYNVENKSVSQQALNVGTPYRSSDHDPIVVGLNLVAAVAPTIISPTSTSIATTSATLGGNVVSDGLSAITDRGVVYSVTTANNNPEIGGGSVTQVSTSGTTGVFTVAVSGLSPVTGYSFKAYATNSVGTSYTTVSTFTTATPPAFTATAARTLSTNSISQSQLSALVPEIWYRARLTANRAYQISAWPVDHEQSVDAPNLSVTLFSDDAGTVPAAGVSGGTGPIEASANDGGDAKPFTAIIQPTTTGLYKIRVQRLSGGAVSHTVNLMLRETTLFSPWTSRAAGFEGFIELHNNTNAAISVTLRAFDNAGTLQGAGLTLTLQPNATDFRTASQIGVPVNVFAGIVLTHDGALGAVSANITTLNTANGLSFDSAFTLRDASVQARPVR